MTINYTSLETDLENGLFRQNLEEELTEGFRALIGAGEPLPPATHYSARIAEIVNNGAPAPIDSTLAFHLYQEILLACEEARTRVLNESTPRPS